ncbi:MAG: SDR family NAD(P)-dependent oxidoreductase [Crocinitomix sp.]|nr:SDR family NAD(P)-dependent oxidoreductase [Crocinitomix sp.]
MGSQQNKLAYITGSSRGIGAALVDLLLGLDYQIIGIARTYITERPNFKSIQLDLNDLEAVRAFNFSEVASEVLLINNAGLIGEIAPIGQVADRSIEEVINVNTIAPQILMNKFIKTYLKTAEKGHIINISSGAGKQPIDAWASYCASKAALDIFSRTTAEELKTRGSDNWHIHAIAPGVVDTQMQTDIRQAKSHDFKLLDHFVALKNDNELSAPKIVAAKIYKVIDQPTDYPETVISVRNF